MRKVVLAIAAHPDDIEFMMAGTLILLGKAGYKLHYMNIANGSCGSATLSKEETIAVRTRESEQAASFIGAKYYPPFVDDIEILYDAALIRKVCAVIRQANPHILLLPSPQDYMEDHMNASRVAVTAAFCRNMKNYLTDPPVEPVESEMCIYHALPYGLEDQLRNPVKPHFLVDVGSVMEDKAEMLGRHQSQKQWLDDSQGVDNYINNMKNMSSRAGRFSGRDIFAEGWRQHSSIGFGPEELDLLGDALMDYLVLLEN